MPQPLIAKISEAQSLANKRRCPVIVYQANLTHPFYGCAFTLPRFGDNITTVYPEAI